MVFSRLIRRPAGLVLLAACAVGLAACSSGGPKPMMTKKKRPLEYFSESEYGVKASPRVSNLRTNLPRGGGRDQTGKPYQVRGKWYYPKEDKKYKKVGAASWYGDAFHGRLTANGEIYDMTHLTGAHPTMPLPSYARVTNMKNGSSVIVRVNDRGPYAHGRIIDLSRKAAEMLDYTHDGVATVKVEYVGRAPLDGRDDRYLMASYRPGNASPDPSDGMPTGVMIAMNGNTPSDSDEVLSNRPDDGQVLELPEYAPVVPADPDASLALATMGYASTAGKADPFAAMAANTAGWKAPAGEYIALGTFADAKGMKAIAKKLASYGKVEAQQGEGGISLTLTPTRAGDMDNALRAAWAVGAKDALTVRP